MIHPVDPKFLPGNVACGDKVFLVAGVCGAAVDYCLGGFADHVALCDPVYRFKQVTEVFFHFLDSGDVALKAGSLWRFCPAAQSINGSRCCWNTAASAGKESTQTRQ